MASGDADHRSDDVVREVARWTHAWMCAAALTLARMETSWDDEDPVRSIGERDVLALVVVDAVRNTHRGACAVLGPKSAAVQAFERKLPDIKKLRDRLEHFDDYVRGNGWAQQQERQPLELDGSIGLEITSSTGGGSGGHTIEVKVRGRKGDKAFLLETRPTVYAARELARETIEAVG